MVIDEDEFRPAASDRIYHNPAFDTASESKQVYETDQEEPTSTLPSTDGEPTQSATSEHDCDDDSVPTLDKDDKKNEEKKEAVVLIVGEITRKPNEYDTFLYEKEDKDNEEDDDDDGKKDRDDELGD